MISWWSQLAVKDYQILGMVCPSGSSGYHGLKGSLCTHIGWWSSIHFHRDSLIICPWCLDFLCGIDEHLPFRTRGTCWYSSGVSLSLLVVVVLLPGLGNLARALPLALKSSEGSELHSSFGNTENEDLCVVEQSMSGWWFGTCFIFPFHIWDNSSHWRTHIFQDGYCKTTNNPCVGVFMAPRSSKHGMVSQEKSLRWMMASLIVLSTKYVFAPNRTI